MTVDTPDSPSLLDSDGLSHVPRGWEPRRTLLTFTIPLPRQRKLWRVTILPPAQSVPKATKKLGIERSVTPLALRETP